MNSTIGLTQSPATVGVSARASQALRRIMATGIAVALSLVASAAYAETSAPTRALQSIDFVTMPGDRVMLTLTLSEPAPQPVVFTVDNPARVSIDLPETRSALAERFKKINVGKTRSVATAEAKGRTRVVIELTELVPHEVRVDRNRIHVELDVDTRSSTAIMPPAMAAQQAASAAPAPAVDAPAAMTIGGVTPPPRPQSKPAPMMRSGITNIDFRRGEQGEGRIVVALGDPQTAIDVREEGGKIIADFKNTQIPDRLIRRLDVLDFATPVKFIDALRDGVNSRITVTPVSTADFDQVAYQSGNLFTLELQPITAEAREDKRNAEPQYSGERISLSFQNVSVRALLQIIADVAGTNMVVSDSVSGEVALRLQNVPWDQALDIILRTKGLAYRQEGNVMLVAPLEEIATREKAELEAIQQAEELAPLRSEIIQVNYAKAAEIASLLKAADTSMMSERGRVTTDERTNTLLIQETRDRLGDIRKLVSRLDVPVRQVLIESRIVIANSDFTKEIGSRFGVTSFGDGFGQGFSTTSGNVLATGTSTGNVAGGSAFSVPTTLDRLNVNLPVAGSAGRIAFGIVGSDYLLDLELSALQAEGRGELISTPRVITANAKEASIEQGVEIPYQQASSSGATTVSFKKAVLSLKVTPQITPDERIIMDLEVNNDSVGQVVSDAGGGNVPSIDTRKVVTQVLVNNGETVVLGGIYEQTNNDVTTKVPFLGDLPIVGTAFRNKRTVSNKAELLIFVTPKILSEGLSIN